MCDFWTSRCLFQTYLGNRLSTIRDSSDPLQWRYVDSKRNTVDVASRGETLLHRHKAEMFSGPGFVWNHYRHWPEMPGNMSSVEHDDSEITRNATIVVAKEANCFLHDLIACFSSWIKLLKAIAWSLSFKTFCKAKFLHKAGLRSEFPRKDFMSCEEINHFTAFVAHNTIGQTSIKSFAERSKSTILGFDLHL